MSLPDPVTIAVTGGLVLGGANQVAKQAQDFLAAATGHPGESLGTILGNMTHRRIRNAEGMMSRAHFTLLNIGVTAKEIPLKIVHPLLEAASLEEDPELQELWVNLLANAADPRRGNVVYPSFILMAKELTPREAKLLASLHALLLKNVLSPYKPAEFSDYDLKQAYAEAGLSRQPRLGALSYGDFQEHGDDLNADLKEFAVSLDLIKRLGIIVGEVTTEPIDLGKIESQIRNKALRSKLNVDSKTRYMFSALGRQFMSACQKPPKAL